MRGNGVFFEDLGITFGNGQQQHVAIRSLIPQRGGARVIGLAGGARSFRHVDLRYRRIPGGAARR